jgi:HEPN domain-containing protein
VLIREVGARPLTHSLCEMAKRLGQVRAVELSEDVASCAKSLEEHFVQAMYPDARLGPCERGKAEECLCCLEMLWRWIGGLK